MTALNPANKLAPWSDADVSALRQLIGLELPMSYIAQRLRRPLGDVRQKAHRVAVRDMLSCPPLRDAGALGAGFRLP